MKTLLDMFLKGGPVMWPILALSVVGLAILVWKAFEIRAGLIASLILLFPYNVIEEKVED